VIKLKKATIFTMGLMAGMLGSLGAMYFMNKEEADKAIKKTVNDAKKMIEKM